MKRTYQLKGELDFKETPQLNPLVEAALRAANRGEQFYDTARVQYAGQTITLYLLLQYQGNKPVSIEVGQELPTAQNILDAIAKLPPEDGTIKAATMHPWAVAPLVQRWQW